MNTSTDNIRIGEGIRKKINELYSMSGYMDKYGSDVWISFIICVVFILFSFKYQISNALDLIKSDWPNQKCNPLLMPFAGFINKPTNKTNLEFTAENFTGCIMSILEYITQISFNPFQIVMKILADAINYLVDSFNMMRGLLDKMRASFGGLFDQMYAAMSNLMVAFINFIVKIKDSMAKANGLLTAALYTLYGAYMAMESLFLSMINLMVIILIVIAGIMILFICVAVGLFPVFPVGPVLAGPFVQSAMLTSIVFICILIPVVWFMIMLMRVLRLSSPPAPQHPSCFAEATLIPLFEAGKTKCIKDIKLGDKLKDGGSVTAIMQFAAAEQNLYMLNGTLVTGEHRVYHPELEWIKVKNHPDSQYIPNFNEPYVYCLNTDTKVFVIGETLFSDWDDIDTDVLDSLEKNCVSLPRNFTYADIHIYLENGLHPDTTVKRMDGSLVALKDVKINDVLENNTKVLGVIQCQGVDVELYKHTFNETFIYGTKNIHVDEDLGICMRSESMRSKSMRSQSMRSKSMRSQSMRSAEKVPVLYHLLTDSKFFIANNLKLHDYNYGIDAYLN
jgi:hypothetical protein